MGKGEKGVDWAESKAKAWGRRRGECAKNHALLRLGEVGPDSHNSVARE